MLLQQLEHPNIRYSLLLIPEHLTPEHLTPERLTQERLTQEHDAELNVPFIAKHALRKQYEIFNTLLIAP